jgi:hypothetical protein
MTGMKLLVITVLFSVGLQSPAPQQQNVKSRIEGIVVRAGTTEPLAKARITLVPAAGSGPGPGTQSNQKTVTTDKNGRFVLNEVETGQYRLAAARNGYARQEYGQRSLARPGIVLNVSAGQNMTNVVIALQPAGTVTGRITNEAGDPLAGIDVSLLRPTYNFTGTQTLTPFAMVRTDDLGEYRLYWVTPGRYYISASSSGGIMTRFPNFNEVLDDNYGTLYYPGTPDASRATTLDIQPGSEITRIDFLMTQQTTYTVKGRLLDGRTGQRPRNASVFITPRQPTGAMGIASRGPNYNAANGTFELQNVLPGNYWVRASGFDDPSGAPLAGRIAGQLAVDVSGADVENLTLTLLAGISIPGRLAVEGVSALTTIENFDRIRVFATPTVIGSMFAPAQPQNLKADGTFVLQGVFAGEYRISLLGLPPTYYIKDARLGTKDILEAGFSIAGSEAEPLQILLSPNAGHIDGNVTDERGGAARGVQAVLIPERDRDRRDLYKTATTDQNGHFSMQGVAPAAYKLFAWEELESFAYFDADLLRRYELQGKPIVVSESSKLAAEIKLIPAGQ